MISIVLPVYNAEPYLRECLDSVLSQTYSDFELIAVDDGSTDSSLGILREYQDPRIRVFSLSENRGISEARNKGLSEVKGELVAFIDADDIYRPMFLSRMIDMYNKYHCIIRCNYSIDFHHTDVGASILAFPNFLNSVYLYIYPTELVKDTPFIYRYTEDVLWITKVLLRANEFVSISEDLYEYRHVNPDSLTARGNYPEYQRVMQDTVLLLRDLHRDRKYIREYKERGVL